MTNRFNSHVRNDKAKWAIVTIALLLVGVILCGIMTSWFKEWNPFCWFGHNYGEDNKCIRCGIEKVVEETKPEQDIEDEEVEPVMMTATASALYASNGISAQSDIPSGYKIAKVGDSVQGMYINFSFAVDNINTFFPDHKIKGVKLLDLSDGRSVYFLGTDGNDGYSFSFYESNLDGQACEELEELRYDTLYDFEDSYVTDFEYYYPQVPSLNGVTIKSIVSTYGNYLYTRDVKELPAAPSKTGYTFTGWYTDEACTNKYTATTVTGDITLYAGFRAHTYSIKFNANSGSGNMSNLPMTYDTAKNLTTNAFTKDHYRFVGWATSSNGNVVYSDKQSVKNLSSADGGTVELFAIWERSEVKVDFIADGKTTTTWVAIGTKATLPANPVKEGHNFVGWYYANGTQYTTQTVSEDITLTAKFEIIQCTVTFMVDGHVYAVYVCDWGTKLSEALNANNVNLALMRVEDEHSLNF